MATKVLAIFHPKKRQAFFESIGSRPVAISYMTFLLHPDEQNCLGEPEEIGNVSNKRGKYNLDFQH